MDRRTRGDAVNDDKLLPSGNTLPHGFLFGNVDGHWVSSFVAAPTPTSRPETGNSGGREYGAAVNTIDSRNLLPADHGFVFTNVDGHWKCTLIVQMNTSSPNTGDGERDHGGDGESSNRQDAA
jgi:hypothetical protein